jgi:hypothetical protein
VPRSIGAELQDGWKRDRMNADPDGRPDRVPADDKLIGRHDEMGEVAPGAAVRLGIADARDTSGGCRGVERLGEFLRFVPRQRMGRHVLAGELAHLRAEGLMLVGFEEVACFHASSIASIGAERGTRCAELRRFYDPRRSP